MDSIIRKHNRLRKRVDGIQLNVKLNHNDLQNEVNLLKCELMWCKYSLIGIIFLGAMLCLIK